MPSALEIMKNMLEQNTDLQNRSSMSANNIIKQLGLCLNNTYFLFQDQIFEQTKGAAMGSPVSPIVANIYMEAFENSHLNCTAPPRIWKRYVDDTFVIQHQLHKENFFRHINSVDPSIQFIMEESKVPYPC